MKKFVVGVLLICYMFFGSLNTIEAMNLTTELSSTLTEVKHYGEVYIKVKLDGMDSDEKGINAYKATIEYDREVFEEINSSNFIVQNGWFELEYNPENGEFVLINKVGIKEEQEIVLIRLNVKKDAQLGTTTVTIKDAVTSNGVEDIECEYSNIDIEVVGNDSSNDNTGTNDGSNTNNGNNNETSSDNGQGGTSGGSNSSDKPSSDNGNNVDEKVTDNSDNETDSDNNDKDNTINSDDSSDDTESKDEEKSNEEEKDYTLVIVLFVCILFIILIVILLKKLKDKDDDKSKKLIKSLIVVSILLPTTISVCAALGYLSKGDVNDDKTLDYTDVNLIEKHLVDLLVLSSPQADVADMNSDGEITVTDLSLLVYKVERFLNYELEISELYPEKNYYEKDTEVGIILKGTVNYGGEVKKVVIDDEEYDVEKLTTGEYVVYVEARKAAGIKKYTISKALLDNDKYVTIDREVKIDVLKDIPFVQNYEFSEDLVNQKITVSFDLIDEDNSLEYIKAQLYSDNNELVCEKDVEVGFNKIRFDVEEEKKYILKVVADYDRDTNKLDSLPNSDNKIKKQMLLEKEVMLVTDYGLVVDNLVTYKENLNTSYFAKNEKIKLSFDSSNNTELEVSSVTINNKEYEVVKENDLYFVLIDGYSDSGLKTIKITNVTLANGKVLEVIENNTCEVDILKDKPEIVNFSYNENEKSNYVVSFEVKDSDKALIEDKKIIITSEDGKEVLNTEITDGKNSFEFEITTNAQIYNVKIVANYDLDTNTLVEEANKYSKQVLLDEEIDLGRRAIEMKAITSVEVYEEVDGEVSLVQSLNINKIDVTKYIVKVNMKDMPSFYTTIKEVKEEDGMLVLVLDYENVVQYEDGGKQDSLEVVFGNIKNNVATSNNLNVLIEEMKKNPDGEFELTSDIDASAITTDYIFTDEFSGTLNGNGYTIYNVTKPLFNDLQGATIENLVLEDVSLSSVRGAIATDAVNTTIKNVHIKNLVMKTSQNATGSFVGALGAGSIITESSATNIKITGGNKRTGGIAGAMFNGTIDNCYVEGVITTTADGLGGIAGSGENNSKITNSIVDLELTSTAGPGYNGGIIGHSMNVLLTNNVSLADGDKLNKISGTGMHSSSLNNYELKESLLVSNEDGSKVIAISSNEINKDFYQNKVGLKTSVWNLNDVSYTKIPTLKNDDPNAEENKKTEQVNSDLYIPEYVRLQNINGFDKNKEILYANLYKLMPYYDAKYYVLDGNNVAVDNVLNKKVIKEILAIDKNGDLVVSITNKDYKNLDSIKVIFENDTVKEYKVTYSSYYGNIVSYKINELGLYYNFDRYVINEDNSLISELSSYIERLDYTIDLDSFTEGEDSRLYKDYYNEVTSKEGLEMILKLFSNSDEYGLTIDNEILNNKIKEELINDGKLKEYVYAYNYYRRWYSILIDEVNVYDLVMYEGKMFSNSMTLQNVVNEVMMSNSNKNTNATNAFYTNNIAKYTGYAEVGDFLDYIIKTIGGYSDTNDWFTYNYQGIVYEVEIEDKKEIEYRAWRQLKRLKQSILPILTLPSNSAYIISSPTQLLIGAQRIYISNPDDAAQRAELVKRVEDYAKNIDNFYTTASAYIPAERFNLYTDLQIDHRFTKNESGETEYQSAGTTNEPFHKNYNEAIGMWAAANGSAAYANGSTVFWNYYSALTSFSTWSHETGHNQDGKIFMNGNGRRGWAEDYADGNITQGGDDGGVNFNLTYEYDMDDEITTNLTPERIDSLDKIHSYYERMFETSDFLDYIEALAFLELTPEEQAKVAVQVYYPNKENASIEEQLAGDEVTAYRVLTAADFEKMNLKTVEDLWDNQIVIRPGVTDVSTTGTNLYGGFNFYTINWYQPHNDNGRPDSYNFKRLAWEMLGIAGYYDGYITYYSNISSNDLDALRKVTKDNDITWKEYKLGRYQLMQDNWDNMLYLDADLIYEQYLQALKTDAANNDRNVSASTNVKRVNYHYIKRATNDFEVEVFGEKSNVVYISTAEEFKTLISNKPTGSYALKNDIDMSSLTGDKAIIEGTFTGSLDGNGYKIVGNKLPIFENIKYSYINNLVIENSVISTTDKEVGALAKTMYYSNISDVHVINASVTADSRAGGIVGYVIRSFVHDCRASANVVANGNAVAAFMGEINYSYVTNSYSTGYVKGRQDIGGFVGWADSTYISNSYSSADTESTVGSGNGGFIGQARNTTKVINCVSFGDVVGGYKFDGRTAVDLIKNYLNNFEYAEAIGVSTLTRSDVDFTNKITILTKDKAYVESFYTNTLGWDNNIWDFSKLSEEKLPTLKSEK